MMEFIEGGELFQKIASKEYKLTEAKCRDLFRQMLLAMDFVHAHRIVHLDLKPHNIVMVGNEGEQLKIIDFGLARRLVKDRMSINACGTLDFMAPEVLRCSHFSLKSDIWSLGVVLYMMLSGGVAPFSTSSVMRTQRNILRGRFAGQILDKVDVEAKRLVNQLLVVDDNLRPCASECLSHPWLTSVYVDTLRQLETQWMRRYLAKRRWIRWFNAIKAMNRMRIYSNEEDNLQVPPDQEQWV